MNEQEFYNSLVNIKKRFDRLPIDRQRRIIRKANRKVNTDLKEAKDLWLAVRNYLKQ